MIAINIGHKTFSARGLAKAHTAIADFKLSLNQHEFVCLVGPSGCGKTTLLNIIAGLDQEFVGTIRFQQEKPQPSIGYVFQNPRLLPWRTVRENIELVLPNARVDDQIEHLLAVMQLTDFQHVYPEHLSLGMSRRVAIIRAFAVNPELLLMDEPFVSLDGATAKQVRMLLMALWQQRPHTVLFVTHDLREAIELADRIVFLSPSPTRVVDEVAITIPRSQRQQEEVVNTFRAQLINNRPELKLLG